MRPGYVRSISECEYDPLNGNALIVKWLPAGEILSLFLSFDLSGCYTEPRLKTPIEASQKAK